jgi:NAD(P)-dependent dehydrogenase (short-subunit alcohol dehydrogenase family)
VVAVDLPVAVDAAEAVAGVELVGADVTNPAQVEAVFANWGSRPPLRVVVNCAGVAPSERIVGKHGVHDVGTDKLDACDRLSSIHRHREVDCDHVAASRGQREGRRLAKA